MCVAVVLLLLAAVGAVPVARAAVVVGATLDRDRAAVGEQVVLTISVEGGGQDVQPPVLEDLPGVRIFRGGQSERFSFVNGRVSAEHSYTFYLQPTVQGSIEIGPVRVTVDGRTYETNALVLEVTAPGSGGPAPEPAPSTPGGAAAGDDAFVTMSVDRDSVVVGEQVVLTFGFYRSMRLSSFESPQYSPPRTEGFWREDLPPEQHSTRVIRSRRYNVTEIRYALFPTRAGDLEIGEATVRLPEDLFGSLLRSRRSRRGGPRLLRAGPLVVHVSPLPEPTPADFSGTVARELELEASIDRRRLEAGQALTLRIRLEGDGYLPAAEPPALTETEDFRIHQASSGADSHPRGGRLHGVRTLEQLVIPRRPGRLTLPGLHYTYFDTDTRSYRTLTTEPIALQVLPGENASAEPVFAGGRKSEIELISRDIRYLRPLDPGARPWGGPLPGRSAFWVAAVLPGLAWLGSVGWARRRQRWLADPRRARARRALRAALAVLDGEGDAPDRAEKALRVYVADRFDRPVAGMRNEEIDALLTAAGVDSGRRERARALLRSAEAARYAPAQGADTQLLQETRVCLQGLEEVLRAR